MHLDFVGAWQMHPFIYAVIAGAAVFAWERYICKKNVGKWLKGYCIVCIILMIIFYIWRMYRYFPNHPPMSYYRYNLISIIMHLKVSVSGVSLR